MSAILSADDLNDFISPGLACIKPIETLPSLPAAETAYQVTTEDQLAAANAPPTTITLTDCLACSGCVTSAEAVLVSLQSHNEVLRTLDTYPSLPLPWSDPPSPPGPAHAADSRLFIATISPQSRASLAALHRTSSAAAGTAIAQLLAGPRGVAAGGRHGSRFGLVLDSNVFRDVGLVMAATEAVSASSSSSSSSSSLPPAARPVLTSACPGWVCYAEKTHAHALPHLSRVKSPQALAGTMVKSLLWRRYGVAPHRVWHLAVMPCFDKKLEASRPELSAAAWDDAGSEAARDVDCVVTVRELLLLAESRGIDVAALPRGELRMRGPVEGDVDEFLFPRGRRRRRMRGNGGEEAAGTSGGYLWHVLKSAQAACPGSRIEAERGRNADVVDYRVVRDDAEGGKEVLFRAARYYGFRNIQNLVRRLKPAKASRLPGAARRGAGAAPGATASALGASDLAYVEVMACPGGCTNGGGQIKAADLAGLGVGAGELAGNGGAADQKKWLAKTDEAYWSASEESGAERSDDDGDGRPHTSIGDVSDPDVVNGVSTTYIKRILDRWADLTGIDVHTLCYTSYRAVESDVGKGKGKKTTDVERVAGLAASMGGGW